ncbi:MAG: HAD family hydrolase [Muribaculaceae bacterium]|nr:HAD family hydrolase [Muribaculaceae bacterium]
MDGVLNYMMSPRMEELGDVMVFDLDDTLAPEREFLRSGFRALKHKLSRTVGEEFAVEAERRMNEAAERRRNHYSALEKLLEASGLTDSVDMREVVRVCRNHYPDAGYELRPDARWLLTALRHAGTTCCLITDGRSLTQRNKIASLGLYRYLDPHAIFISGETGFDKHHAYPFEEVMRRYPGARSYTYIGDNPAKDFLHPRALGWKTYMLSDEGRNISPQSLVLPESMLAGEIIDDLSRVFWKNVMWG